VPKVQKSESLGRTEKGANLLLSTQGKQENRPLILFFAYGKLQKKVL